MTREDTRQAIQRGLNILNSLSVELYPLRSHKDPAVAATATVVDELVNPAWICLHKQRQRFDDSSEDRQDEAAEARERR